jgi:hypothetical protein
MISRITLQYTAVVLALISAPLRCAAQQEPCDPGTIEVTVTPGLIRKYLREHPNWWDERSNGILYNVLFSQCLRQRG